VIGGLAAAEHAVDDGGDGRRKIQPDWKAKNLEVLVLKNHQSVAIGRYFEQH